MKARVLEPHATPLPQPHRPLRWLAIEKVVPYEANPRDCSERGIELLARSIRENGFLSPIITDERLVILAGHHAPGGRQELGLRRCR